jgi:hypothetical protein
VGKDEDMTFILFCLDNYRLGGDNVESPPMNFDLRSHKARILVNVQAPALYG